MEETTPKTFQISNEHGIIDKKQVRAAYNNKGITKAKRDALFYAANRGLKIDQVPLYCDMDNMSHAEFIKCLNEQENGLGRESSRPIKVIHESTEDDINIILPFLDKDYDDPSKEGKIDKWVNGRSARFHSIIGAFNLIPQPMVLIAALVGCAMYAVFAAAAIKKRYPNLMNRAKKWVYLRRILPKDALDCEYAWMYSLVVLGMIILLALIGIMSPKFPSDVCMALFLSIIGVTLSVIIEGSFAFVDPEGFKDTESRPAQTSIRCLFFHAPVGAAIAILCGLALPALCPLPPY